MCLVFSYFFILSLLFYDAGSCSLPNNTNKTSIVGTTRLPNPAQPQHRVASSRLGTLDLRTGVRFGRPHASADPVAAASTEDIRRDFVALISHPCFSPFRDVGRVPRGRDAVPGWRRRNGLGSFSGQPTRRTPRTLPPWASKSHQSNSSTCTFRRFCSCRLTLSNFWWENWLAWLV